MSTAPARFLQPWSSDSSQTFKDQLIVQRSKINQGSSHFEIRLIWESPLFLMIGDRFVLSLTFQSEQCRYKNNDTYFTQRLSLFLFVMEILSIRLYCINYLERVSLGHQIVIVDQVSVEEGLFVEHGRRKQNGVGVDRVRNVGDLNDLPFHLSWQTCADGKFCEGLHGIVFIRTLGMWKFRDRSFCYWPNVSLSPFYVHFVFFQLTKSFLFTTLYLKSISVSMALANATLPVRGSPKVIRRIWNRYFHKHFLGTSASCSSIEI